MSYHLRKSKRGRGDSAEKRRVKRKESSVVEVVHGLVMSKCIKVDCRVIEVVFVGEARVVVVLVDVYLPIGVWSSGWRFPKSAAKAAQLFRHLRCNQWCRLPVITPCRHLLCLDCVALDGKRCTFPSCNNPYEMQAPDNLTRPENPNPKSPDTWDPDWQSTSSSKVPYLVQRLKEIQYGASSDSCEAPFEKVIIFSQFLEHIHLIEQQLLFTGIKFARMYSPMQSSHKMKSLAIFQQDPNCMALLMDGSTALGLDLSFVTHVF
ncbi:F-box protein-like protein [Drosera capensis]